MRAAALWLVCLGAAAPAPPAADGPKPYALALSPSTPRAAVGDPLTVRLSLTPSAPFRLKIQTPMHLTARAEGGLQLARATFDARDWSPATAEASARHVDIGAQASAPGGAQVAVEIAFFLCSHEICRRFVDRAELALEVAPAPTSAQL